LSPLPRWLWTPGQSSQYYPRQRGPWLDLKKRR
jgi:hypothetical protein